MGVLESLEDWGVKEAVNAALKGLVADGSITVANETTIDQATIIITNMVLKLAATKVGADEPLAQTDP